MALMLALAAMLHAQVEPGTLPRSWRTGGPNCAEVPAWQVHEYNPDFYILRESGCTNYEKPFLYLIFGKDRALLEDTGAGSTVNTGDVVMGLVADWSKRNKRAPIPLLVTHSHAHGDHVAGDAQFAALGGSVQLVKAAVPDLQAAFAIKTWPTTLGQIDLGGRILDVIPIPGHDVASVAYYDRKTGVLLSGDSFYPGRLYVTDATFPAFAASTQRLVDFTRGKPVAHILGTHIEQSHLAFIDYPTGTMFQPDEAPLELSRGDLLELNEAIVNLKGKLAKVALRSMTLSPRVPPANAPAAVPAPAPKKQ
jgi:hydroxyacylglutathione hydrolase